jgi:16S rRNA (guanine966-N2)-methyltransferase
MRVIGGIYRRRTLKGPEGLDARPTSDRLRETLFNILQPMIDGSRFLDVCAGSGAVGIEALSREAVHATFVERSRPMSALIQANLDHCAVPVEDYSLVNSDALAFLRTASRQTELPWDLVYYDPPYEVDHLPVLEFLAGEGGPLLQDSARIMVEHRRNDMLPAEIGRLRSVRQLRQADTCVDFYEFVEM